MNIKLEFETYEEMVAFARKLTKEGKQKSAVPAEKAEVVTAKEEAPAVEEKPKKEEVSFEEDKPTIQDVRAVLAEKKKQGKDIKALIASFGAEKLSQVKEEDYAALLKKAGEL